MNTLIYPVEYTGIVKNYSDWVNHENVEVLKSLGYTVGHSIVSMKGGAFYRVSISIKRSWPSDREIAKKLAMEMFKDCDAHVESLCNHNYRLIGDGIFMKVNNNIYEVQRCSWCHDSIKFEVGNA